MAPYSPLASPQPFLRLLAAAERRPEAIGLITPDRQHSYAEMARHALSIATMLHRRGVRAGDVVVVSARDDLQALITYALFALGAIGGIYPGVLPASNEMGVDWLVVDGTGSAFIEERTILADQGFFDEAVTLDRYVQVENYDAFDSVCRIVFSSGSTGLPSPVPLSVEMLERRAQVALEHWMPMHPFFSTISIASSIGLVVATANLATLTPYFNPGSAAQNLAMIERHFIGAILSSTAQLGEIARLAEGSDRLGDLAVIEIGGASPSASLVRALRSLTDAQIVSVFGSTESGGLMKGTLDEEGDVEFEPPFPGVEFEVVDEHEEPLPNAVVGRLRCRSTMQASHYFGDEARTVDSFRDGWFYLGDFAAMRDDGSVRIEGRSSEIANFGGVKVDLCAIDHSLNALDGITDAAAFVVEDDLGVCTPAIAYVPSHGYDEATLRRAATDAAQGVGPSAIVQVSVIARSETGTVRRALLAEEFARGHP